MTIRKLAERFGYSPRTIYLHYADKEDLLRAIAEYGFEATVKELEENDYYKGLSPEEHLRTAIANHLRTAMGNVNYYNTVIHVIQGVGFEPGPNQVKVEGYLSDNFGPYLDSEETTPEFSLFFLFASLRGIAVELTNRRPPQDAAEMDRAIEMVFHFYRNLLRNQTGERDE